MEFDYLWISNRNWLIENDSRLRTWPPYWYSGSAHLKMLFHLMTNKLPSIGVELEKDQCKSVEMRELNK